MDFTEADYAKDGRPRYGAANPQKVESLLWTQMAPERWNAYQLREKAGDKKHAFLKNGEKFPSLMRERPDGPVWSFDRFGVSSTKLDDGCIIHVGGEHEDFYDSDFCIYNDVIVEHPGGRFDFISIRRTCFLRRISIARP